MRKSSSCLAALLTWVLTVQPAVAELPTATGRQIALSNSAWKLFIPSTYQQRPGSVADVLIHFHGDPQTIWNNSQYADLNAIIVTVNYNGLSSAYSTPFSSRSLFRSLVDEALAKVRDESDFSDTLQWDQIGVSSFSAGYGAVREILKNESYRNDIDAVLAADSLYATTAGDGTALDSQMVNYKQFASQAQANEKTFLFSHSQVLTFTYENTAETGNELMEHLGISANPVSTEGLGTLDFYRHVKSGQFQLWGAEGADAEAHLEHLRYIGHFLKELPLSHLPNLEGDFDQDEDVDGNDLLNWQRYRSTDPWSGSELTDWQAAYGTGVAPFAAPVTIPEPASVQCAMFAISVLLTNFRRNSVRRARETHRCVPPVHGALR